MAAKRSRATHQAAGRRAGLWGPELANVWFPSAVLLRRLRFFWGESVGRCRWRRAVFRSSPRNLNSSRRLEKARVLGRENSPVLPLGRRHGRVDKVSIGALRAGALSASKLPLGYAAPPPKCWSSDCIRRQNETHSHLDAFFARRPYEAPANALGRNVVSSKCQFRAGRDGAGD